MTSVISESRTGRSLVPAPLYAKLVHRVVDDDQVSHDYAERVMDQALAFLGTCAVSDIPLSPSDAVDPGWHAFILYTQEYADFCESVAGHFIHHVPTDDADTAAHGAPAKAVIERTVREMRHAGFEVDHELWKPVSAKCSQCHNGCTDSPRLH